MSTPIHPISKTALIPVIRTHPDGRQQRYWISLKKFMEDREKGIEMQRIPRKEHVDVAVPEKEAPIWEMEFIENLEDFNSAGLIIDNDKLEVEIVAEVHVIKNGKQIKTYKIKKLDREAIARTVLKKIMEL